MGSWYWSVTRTAVQAGWGLLVGWGAQTGLSLPEQVPDAVVSLVGILLVVAVLRMFERTPEDSPVRKIARVLMLGAGKTPEYARDTEMSEALSQLLHLAEKAYPLVDGPHPAGVREAIDQATTVLHRGKE